jgi:hypothetical protein
MDKLTINKANAEHTSPLKVTSLVDAEETVQHLASSITKVINDLNRKRKG